MAKTLRLNNDYQKIIVDKISKLSQSGKHRKWTVWSDFVAMTACTLSLADIERRGDRERIYSNIAKKYNKTEMEIFYSLFIDLVNAYESNQEQDLLGDLFMKLELGNDYAGQFFTPYSVCVAMAALSAGNLKAEIEKRGYISVNDPCCGAGALLIAFANEAKRQGINYQRNIEFVAQDIDFTAAMMCYIQLSLLGCAGYVIVGNTLTTPPTEPLSNQNVWYTPLYFLDVWHWRRTWKMISRMNKSIKQNEKIAEPDKHEEKKEFTANKNGQLTFF
ncbi:MAG: N-6 DNA methylase [Sedimentibacter sp.]